MTHRFFVLNTSDLTNDILEKSIHSNNPYLLRKSFDGNMVLIKCECKSVSVDLFKLGIVAMNKAAALAYINDPINGFVSSEEG